MNFDADWDRVNVEIVTIHDERYGNPFFQRICFYTAGSLTVQAYFDRIRIAGRASQTAMLVESAADRWGVPVAELETEPSVVVHPASDRRLSYGEIVSFTDGGRKRCRK